MLIDPRVDPAGSGAGDTRRPARRGPEVDRLRDSGRAVVGPSGRARTRSVATVELKGGDEKYLRDLSSRVDAILNGD